MPTIPKAILSHSVRTQYELNYSKTLAYYLVSKNMTGEKEKRKKLKQSLLLAF